jgi:23S rRNA (cytidine1920-2'-O)/16S rRNA (cytidine1409-2'-O)-methyltransferase
VPKIPTLFHIKGVKARISRKMWKNKLDSPRDSESSWTRLDQWLVEEGYYESREKARRAVMAGEIEIEGKGNVLKPGNKVGPSDRIIVKSKPRFVSRGGDKLDAVLERWQINVRGLDVLDAGASTGGFTHVLLERGASRVIAVDVGRGQLHWDLRRDPRVIVMEGVNVRRLMMKDLPFKPLMVTADLSFISLRLVLPVFAEFLDRGRYLVSLIKPQFEAGRGKVGKKGIVREPDVHREVLQAVLGAAKKDGFRLRAIAPSPIKGADGNIEFFAWWVRDGEGPEPEFSNEIEKAVSEAWGEK